LAVSSGLSKKGAEIMSSRLRIPLWVVLMGMLASVPVFAGSAVIGSVAGSLNASVGGQTLLPNTVIFSGDSLQVKDGAAVVALENGSRMAFGRNTVASFLRETNAVTVLISQGNVSLFHPDDRVGVQVKAGDVSIEAARGYKTLGDVAMANGAVVVTSKEGTLRVQSEGKTIEVAKGQTVTVGQKTARAPQAGGSQKLGGTSDLLAGGALAAGGVAAILAGIGMSRAGNARDNAAAANSTAASALSAANAATSAASAAGSSATDAANNANSVGCALNDFNAETYNVSPSPYTPMAPYTCPALTVTPH
jgi:hypothetical protein